jgi:ribosomal protein S18 acetylase RimI-like enzyme
MPQIIIREYRDSDFPHLGKVHDEARRNELRLANLSDAFLPFYIAAERENFFDYDVFVAEMDNAVVGFAAITEDEIAWFYVDVDVQRRGVGRALMTYVLDKVSPDADIEVLVGNEPALKLYESFGFRIEKDVRGVMPGNEEFPVHVYVLRRDNV